MVPTSRTSDNVYKLKPRKFHPNIRKHVFYYEGGQTLEKVSQRGCGGNPPQATLLEQGG